MQQQHSLSTLDDDDDAEGFTDSLDVPLLLFVDSGANFGMITPFLQYLSTSFTTRRGDDKHASQR